MTRIWQQPVSIEVLTEIHRDHPESFTPQARSLMDQDPLYFGSKYVEFCQSLDESRRLNYLNGPMIIIASSGMGEAGRIRHHLRQVVSDPDNAIVIVSYQAQGTLGRQIAHWDPFYKLPIDRVLTSARRSADEGLYGYVPAFEPGFGSASYYGDQVPLPVDWLPHCLTGFVYREATWEPALPLDTLKDRIHRRYFSPDAPRRFADDLLYLHQFSLDYSADLCRFTQPHFGFAGEESAPRTVAGEWRRVRAIAANTCRNSWPGHARP